MQTASCNLELEDDEGQTEACKRTEKLQQQNISLNICRIYVLIFRNGELYMIRNKIGKTTERVLKTIKFAK